VLSYEQYLNLVLSESANYDNKYILYHSKVSRRMQYTNPHDIKLDPRLYHN